MAKSNATAEASDLYLLDTSTGATYFLYVSNGQLKMEEIAETTDRENLPFRDASTGIMHNIYVSAGELMIDIS